MVRGIVLSMSVNLSKFSVHFNCGCGSAVLLWRQCNILHTSGFVDDVMFPHNGLVLRS